MPVIPHIPHIYRPPTGAHPSPLIATVLLAGCFMSFALGQHLGHPSQPAHLAQQAVQNARHATATLGAASGQTPTPVSPPAQPPALLAPTDSAPAITAHAKKPAKASGPHAASPHGGRGHHPKG